MAAAILLTACGEQSGSFRPKIGVGDSAPHSENLTVENQDDWYKISSMDTKVPLYRWRISDLLQQGRPFLVVFGTPQHCTMCVDQIVRGASGRGAVCVQRHRNLVHRHVDSDGRISSRTKVGSHNDDINAGTVCAAGFYQGEAHSLWLGREFHHNRLTLIVPHGCGWGTPPRDYPRWDETRAYDAIVSMMRQGKLTAPGLITPVVPLAEGPRVFRQIEESPESVIKFAIKFGE